VDKPQRLAALYAETTYQIVAVLPGGDLLAIPPHRCRDGWTPRASRHEPEHLNKLHD
jgi:hypothetical protein